MKFPYPKFEHQARIVMGDPVALAYEWIKGYAANISGDYDEDYGNQTITAEELIDTAMTWIDPGNRWRGEYISKGGLLEGVSLDPTFWDKLAVFLGREIPQDSRESFFSCSC